ncbi:MAG: AraC family transcriptional regulator [Deltaproteobacteria bacterium]
MSDPLADIVTLLEPKARNSKVTSASGTWRITREENGSPFYLVVLKGACEMTFETRAALRLQAGDYVLVPVGIACALSSIDPAPPPDLESRPIRLADGTMRFGDPEGAPSVQKLVGHFSFGSPDAALLVSLLPQVIHVRGAQRLARLVELIIDESRAERPARDLILTRLLEVMLVEALRESSGPESAKGLMRGLADDRLALALRRIHENPAQAWTIAALADQAALSRSAFFARFQLTLGVAPMEYLLAWRMALGKKLLHQRHSIAEVASAVGYGSASAFSTAFTRYVGVPPGKFARENLLADRQSRTPP